MKKQTVTFLGPYGATFSHEAYNTLSTTFKTLKLTKENYLPAEHNQDVALNIAEHSGYGALAISTRVSSQVIESTEGFFKLFENYDETNCPINIKGTLDIPIRFCLMAQSGVSLQQITRIIAHQKSLDACAKHIQELNIPYENISSNGEAAKQIAENDTYKYVATLGPYETSKTYALSILSDDFSDDPAVTTFCLFAPRDEEPQLSETGNRAIVMFDLTDRPGALVKALQSFAKENIDLLQIHSAWHGDPNKNRHRFLIEADVPLGQTSEFSRAVHEFSKQSGVQAYLILGPYPVLK